MKISVMANKELLIKLASECETLSAILSNLNLSSSSGNYKTLNNYLNLYRIEFNKKPSSNNMSFRRYTDEECFRENSTIARHHVKKRILQGSLIPSKCHICNLSSIWNNKPLVLQLEHKNGINNDNRLCNLAFICPNCHSQSDTYAAKNKKK